LKYDSKRLFLFPRHYGKAITKLNGYLYRSQRIFINILNTLYHAYTASFE